jgi:hypothetical protein
MSNTGHKSEARSDNFIFTIGKSESLRYSVQSSNITEVMLNQTNYPVRGKDLKIPSNKVEHSPLVLDLIISEDYSEWIEIYKWMLSCKNTPHDKIMNYMVPCELTAIDSQGKETARFVYSDCWPTSLEGVTLTIVDNDSQIVTANVTLNYNRFVIVDKDGNEITEDYVGYPG